jgi:hypothetical protein
MRPAGQALDFKVHQALHGEVNHLAQQVAVGRPRSARRRSSQQGLPVHDGVGGHCRVGGLGLRCGEQTRNGYAMTTAMDNWPVSARLRGGRGDRPVIHSDSYTTRWDAALSRWLP